MRAFGWAVIENGKIAVNTVSDTRRAVIVNWLVTTAGVLVLASWTDEHIETLWWKLHGEAQVEQVTISAKLLPEPPAST